MSKLLHPLFFLALALSGCAGNLASHIASSVASAAAQTAIEQAVELRKAEDTRRLNMEVSRVMAIESSEAAREAAKPRTVGVWKFYTGNALDSARAISPRYKDWRAADGMLGDISVVVMIPPEAKWIRASSTITAVQVASFGAVPVMEMVAR